MRPGSVPNRLDRRLLVVVLAIIAVGLALAVATGHHTIAPHAASAVEYGL